MRNEGAVILFFRPLFSIIIRVTCMKFYSKRSCLLSTTNSSSSSSSSILNFPLNKLMTWSNWLTEKFHIIQLFAQHPRWRVKFNFTSSKISKIQFQSSMASAQLSIRCRRLTKKNDENVFHKIACLLIMSRIN